MTRSKRCMDVLLALLLGILLLVPALVIAVFIGLFDGRPVFYRSKRMKTADQSFELWKFRTMLEGSADNSVSGGYKSSRVTPFGRVLRRTRLDEIPQLFNILRGDMSFVGPRPPLPRFVLLRPETYREVLQARPGITGFATLYYHETEERLLRPCRSVQEADRVYIHQCIPAKARLDLCWAQNRSTWRDLMLLWLTLSHLVCGASSTQTLTNSAPAIRFR